MKNLFVCIFFFSLSFVAVAQKRDYHAEIKQYQDSVNKNFPKNTVYLELAGSAITYSINYDRIFYQKNKFKFSYRLGLSILPLSHTDIIDGRDTPAKHSTTYLVPLGFNIIHGRGNRFIEFGVVSAIGYGNKTRIVKENPLTLVYDYQFRRFFSLHLSYRRQSKKGLFFKATGLIIRDEAQKINSLSLNTKTINGIKGLPGWVWWLGIGIGKSF